MSLVHGSLAALAQGDESLTLDKVLSDIPTDPASIFVYLLVVASLVIIIRSGRAKPPRAREDA